LLRKARRLGLRGIDDFIALAVSRGCSHYASATQSLPATPSTTSLSDDELTIPDGNDFEF
jgi:hypothetical protein